MPPKPNSSKSWRRPAFAWWQVECCEAGKIAWPEPCPWHDGPVDEHNEIGPATLERPGPGTQEGRSMMQQEPYSGASECKYHGPLTPLDPGGSCPCDCPIVELALVDKGPERIPEPDAIEPLPQSIFISQKRGTEPA